MTVLRRSRATGKRGLRKTTRRRQTIGHRVERFLHGIGYTVVRFPTWWPPTRSARLADVRIGGQQRGLSEFAQVLFDTTTGMPHRCASIGGMPKLSNSDGNANTEALAMSDGNAS